MSVYIINGGAPLTGTVTVSGAKNSVLPLLCACLLCGEGNVTLENCPSITDVTYTLEILRSFGCKTQFINKQIAVNAENARPCEIPESLTGRLRSASLFLGAASGRFNTAVQSRSGGCELGARPIDMHLSALSKMGCTVVDNDDGISCNGSPHGSDIFLRYPSVGATENIILAAALARGTTTITNAAREPEITELCEFINAMGGRVYGAGGNIIIVEGVEKLHGVNYNIIGDRIEAATYLAAAMATGGDVTVGGINPAHLSAVTDIMTDSGGRIRKGKNSISVSRTVTAPVSPVIIRTAPYPGFPTDAQSLVMAMLLKSHGTTEIYEQVFDDRLRVSAQFNRMGADITAGKSFAVIRGVGSLHGARLSACDLRSGAALVIAALSAKGISTVENISHIERGYEDFAGKLSLLGADIIKAEDSEYGKQNGECKPDCKQILCQQETP